MTTFHTLAKVAATTGYPSPNPYHNINPTPQPLDWNQAPGAPGAPGATPPAQPGMVERIGTGVMDNKYSVIGTGAGFVAGPVGSLALGAAGAGLDYMAGRAEANTHSTTGKWLNMLPGADILGGASPGSLYDWAAGNTAKNQPSYKPPITGLASYGSHMLRQGMDQAQANTR